MSLREGNGLGAKLIRGGLGLGGLKLISLPIGLATSVLMARGLGVEGYGTYSFVLALVSLFALPAYAGLPALLVREVSSYHHSETFGLLNGLIKRAQQLALIMAIPIMIGVLGLAVWKANGGFNERWALMAMAAFIIPFLAMIQVRTAVIQGFDQVTKSQIPGLIIQPSFFLLIGLVLFFSDSLNPVSALVSQMFTITIGLFFVSLIFQRQTISFKATPLIYNDRAWKRSLLPFSAIAGVSYLSVQLLIPLVGLLASDSEVAYFKVAFSIAMLVSAPLAIVETTIHPHVTQVFASGDKKKLFSMVSLAGIAALLFSLPLALIFIIFGQEILETFYGLDYSEAYLPLVIIVTGFVIVNLIGPSMLLLHATNYEKDALIVSTGGAILTLTLCVIWIPEHGATGAAFAFTISKVTRALMFRIWAQIRITKTFREGPRG